MYHRFLKYIKEKNIFSLDDSILLAVSGGKDSMFMVDLFKKTGIVFGIAHFNHMTRDGESDRDENFVKMYCENNSIPFYSVSVNVNELMKRGEGKNFQDFARKLRYQWLEKIRKENDYDYIATAHHFDDNIETFVFKIITGSGLGGLKGIYPKINNIIRPILDFKREEIDEYIRNNKIDYVEDSSNNSDKYSRNFIRHNIIPLFKKMNSNFEASIAVTMRNISSADRTIKFLVDNYLGPYVEKKNDKIIISKRGVEQIIDNKDVIYYLFAKYDFNYSQVENILNSIEKTGPLYESFSHQLLVDRDKIIIRKLKKIDAIKYRIVAGDNEIGSAGFLKIGLMKKTKEFGFEGQKKYINAELLEFPLILRNWKAGDRFKPYGLKGKTIKVKKYLIDKRVNKFDKEETYVLISKNEICCILGHDISYDYRITDRTQMIALIDFRKY